MGRCGLTCVAQGLETGLHISQVRPSGQVVVVPRRLGRSEWSWQAAVGPDEVRSDQTARRRRDPVKLVQVVLFDRVERFECVREVVVRQSWPALLRRDAVRSPSETLDRHQQLGHFIASRRGLIRAVQWSETITLVIGSD